VTCNTRCGVTADSIKAFALFRASRFIPGPLPMLDAARSLRAPVHCCCRLTRSPPTSFSTPRSSSSTAGSHSNADDKLHGSVDIEQIFVDFLIIDQLNWRAPGIDLISIGYINQHHEPTQFYSVNRPELYNGLIPSTWRAPATSIYGTITDGIKYQVQMSSSLEDFGDDFGLRTDANTVPPGPFVAGIDGLTALAFSRPPVGDFRQLSNDLAWAAKLDFTPPFLPGLGWSVSAYYSPNTTPRGAHDDFGNLLGRSSLTMFDAEFRYRVPRAPPRCCAPCCTPCRNCCNTTCSACSTLRGKLESPRSSKIGVIKVRGSPSLDRTALMPAKRKPCVGAA
jgi:hypothetical protein